MSPNTKNEVSRALAWKDAGSMAIDARNEAADVVHAIARLRHGRERLEQRGRLAARPLDEYGHAGAQQIGQACGADLLRHRGGENLSHRFK